MAEPVGPDARPQRVIAVLGMHRSGTSAVTGSLEQHGLFLGDVSTQDVHNPKGNREAVAMRRLNEDVLRSNGGAWNDPPPAVTWTAEQEERARGMLAEHAGRPLWGFKDPRTLLTLDGWRALVPDIEQVGVFRHPARVARSLERRNDMTTDAGVALWLAYNQALLEELRRKRFPVVCFDEDPDTLRAKLLAAAQALGLVAGQAEEHFFTPELRGAEPDAPVAPAAVAVYEELRTFAL
jgi:hypothetical protein